ncbi:MAG: sugar ABC transporter permease [Clostridia bacterium]|nr:sugar ABC transporter permease [Clostridia bacterium]
MMIWPVAQFCVFYIGVNFNSILLSFQDIDIVNGTTTWTFEKIIQAFQDMTSSKNLLLTAKNSLLVYFLSLIIGTPLGLFFSYYIYKKMPGSGAFRVLLFMPSIVSGIVMVAMFQFFVEQAVPQLWSDLFGIKIKGLIENPDTRFGTILFFCIWSGFGTSVLMYSNAMSGISQEVVESAHLDGATGFREFIHITFPMIFPTLSTFLITGVAGIFTNQFALYSFYGGGAPNDIQTYGYYMYMKTKNATSEAEYPILSAMGLWMTIVAVPLTLLVKWALEKFGPSED